MTTIYLDTETTGLSPAKGDRIVELAIVDDAGMPLLDTLVNPGCPIPWYARNVHGISDEMVAGAPSLSALLPRIREIAAASRTLVIYNASFDLPFFPPGTWDGVEVRCAMRRFADVNGTRWQKLDAAARQVRHRWTGDKHRALADALAARSVWRWCEQKARASA